MRLLEDSEYQFLLENYKGISNKDLTDLINNKFNKSYTTKQIKGFKHYRHLDSGLTGRFEKGQQSFNKGKKWDEYMPKQSQLNSSKTTFKKGNIPVNHREVGSERVNVDGYIEIKIEEPNKWELKHRYIYKNTYGDIPKGCKLIFADGNKLNLSLDNLILVSNSEELIMNQNKLFYDEKELTKSGAIIAKVIDKTNRVKNGRL